jgi:predicted phage tail protein
MMTVVKLYGHLRAQFGAEFAFDIDTVGEVFAALNANLPGFRAYLMEHSEPGYRVLVNDEPRTAEELALILDVPSEIQIVPVVQGAGDGKSIGMILGGILLAVVSYGVGAALGAGAAAGGAGAAAGGAAAGGAAGGITLAGTIATVGVGLGASLAVGGISQLVSRQPKSTEVAARDAERRKSYTFGAVAPTIQQGVPIPIAYGENIAEGYPISVRLVVVNELG